MKKTKAGYSKGCSDGGKRTSGRPGCEERANLRRRPPHTAGHGGARQHRAVTRPRFSNDNCVFQERTVGTEDVLEGRELRIEWGGLRSQPWEMQECRRIKRKHSEGHESVIEHHSPTSGYHFRVTVYWVLSKEEPPFAVTHTTNILSFSVAGLVMPFDVNVFWWTEVLDFIVMQLISLLCLMPVSWVLIIKSFPTLFYEDILQYYLRKVLLFHLLDLGLQSTQDLFLCVVPGRALISSSHTDLSHCLSTVTHLF